VRKGRRCGARSGRGGNGSRPPAPGGEADGARAPICKPMADPQDRVDIPGVTPSPAEPARRRPEGRQWLGIFFNCCHVYGRIYKDGSGRRYVGRCPSCAAEVTVPVGPGGTARRFFETT